MLSQIFLLPCPSGRPSHTPSPLPLALLDPLFCPPLDLQKDMWHLGYDDLLQGEPSDSASLRGARASAARALVFLGAAQRPMMVNA